MSNISKQLQEPFDKEDLEWRVQRSGVTNNNPWMFVVIYVTNRAIQQRLDDVLGFEKWRNEFKPTPDGKGYLCGLSIKVGDEWITKWDGAEYTQVEALKGAISGSMKRSAVQFGIGRYLYNLEAQMADCQLVEKRNQSKNNFISIKDKKGNYHNVDWVTPSLPEWALPNILSDDYLDRMDKCEDIKSLQEAFKDSILHVKSFGRNDLKDTFIEKKNEVKERLDVQAQLNVDKALREIDDWLEKQLSTLCKIPEQSSVSRICKTLIKRIEQDSQGQYYDTKPLIERVNQAEVERNNSIQRTTEEA